ncbi:unnamed protein product [Ixodes hexagonus]
MVLAAAGDIPLYDLAALADKVLEVASPTVSNIEAPPHVQQPAASAASSSPSSADFRTLQSEIRSLALAVAALHTERSRSPRPRYRSRSRSSSRSSSNTMCWYHQTFGDQAHKCKPPCSAATGNAMPRH